MWRRTVLRRMSGHQLTPLEVFTQVQLGAMPPVSHMRGFILSQFGAELHAKSISEAKVQAMDARRTGQLLKQLLYDRYLSVPFRMYTFDLEFTGLPRFTVDGPSESIVEVAFYHPESQQMFSSMTVPLVHRQRSPTEEVAEETATDAKNKKKSKKSSSGKADADAAADVDPTTTSFIRPMNSEASAITGITDEELVKNGRPFGEAWADAWQFLTTPKSDSDVVGEDTDILLLSHGGKQADESMLRWALDQEGLKLPSFVHFGDTFHTLRDLHRKRPVTEDKLPPSWSLEEVANWMKLPVGRTHRADVDAKLTWEVLFHTLDRYGDETLTPRQQLVSKFFDTTAKQTLQERTDMASAEAGMSL